MNQEVMILTGAGQIGMAIARRVGYGKKIVIGDKSRENAENISEIMNQAGFDTIPVRNGFILQKIYFEANCRGKEVWGNHNAD